MSSVSAYGPEYYGPGYDQHGSGLPYDRSVPQWLTFFGAIADEIVARLTPRRVLDVGCAKGFLVESLRDRGVEAFGFDISDYAISQVRQDIRPYCWVGAVTDHIRENYDLITCIEVLEHVPEAQALVAIRSMAAHTDVILFSSTPDAFSEPTHVNVHPVLYWLKHFREVGFVPDLAFDAAFVAGQAMLLRKNPIWMSDEVLQLYAHACNLAIALNEARNEANQQADRWAEALKKSEQELQSSRYADVFEVQILRAELERLRQVHEEDLQAHQNGSQELERKLAAIGQTWQELEQTRQELELTKQHLANVESSFGWRLINSFRTQRERYFPTGARRRNVLDLGTRAMKFTYIHGISALRRRVSRKNVLAGEQPERAYRRWIELNEPGVAELEKLRVEAATFVYQPVISIITPTYNTEISVLRACIESVRNQAYPNWELCLCDDASSSAEVREVLAEYAARDPRIKVKYLEQNQGIALASNQALSLATGEFVGLLDHDDEISPNALYEIVRLLQHQRAVDIIYSDEDKLEPDGRRCEPFFKPDWSPELLHCCMYTCHFTVYRKALLDKLGGFRSGFDGSQDYDLMLRATEATERIHHLTKILYHWRKVPASAAASVTAKSYAYDAARRALAEHVARRGVSATVLDSGWPGIYRVKYHVNPERVSIIIPTRDKVEVLRQCIDSIEAKTRYPDYEILVADNNSSAPETRQYLAGLKHRVLSFPGPFNFSLINNRAARQATGRYLLFLNNDTEVISPDWISAMAEFAQQEQVGAVGAKLLYPDDTVQHAGVVVGLGGVAGHALVGFAGESQYYFGLMRQIRNCSAVTAACMMVRRDVFEKIGGFDESMPVAFNDVDFCLRLVRAGYRIVWTPYAALYHCESASRGHVLNQSDIAFMKARWGAALLADPYYNPNLTLQTGDYSLRFTG